MRANIFKCTIFLIILQSVFYASRTAHAGVNYEQTQTLTSPMEMNALFAVMEAIAGDRDWRTLHPQPCTDDIWPGIVCEQGDDGLLHVTRLDFGHRPNPLCTANATIPAAIGKLSSLQGLFLFGCFTSTKTTIPSHLSLLAPSLQQLSLRANSALVGEIPPELGSLSALEVLSLSQNNLEGLIPAEITKLTSLHRLDLSYNKLVGELPTGLGKLKNLVILDLSFNSLSGRLPPWLGSLIMLQKIDLSFNNLHGTLPEELGSLAGLQFLAITDNAIQGPFPNSFSNLTSLQYLIVENNPMNGPLPNFLGSAIFPNLVTLSLSNSGYVGSIPEELCRLSNLTTLSLDRNNLTGSIPAGLANLTHIYQLNLSANMLSGPIPFSSEFALRLGKNLDLDGNAGLCCEWRFPEDSIRPCAELHQSNSSTNSYEISSQEALMHEMRAALLCSIVCFLQLFRGLW